jgi:hypothetical protein
MIATGCAWGETDQKGETGMSPKKEKATKPPADAADVFLDYESWDACFAGYWVKGCSLRDRNTVYVALVEDLPGETCDDPHKFRMVALYLNEAAPAERWGYQGLLDFPHPLMGACTIPLGQGLFVSQHGSVYAAGSKKTGLERIDNPDSFPWIRSVRCISGRGYAAAGGQKIFRRKDIGVWEPLPREGLPVKKPGAVLEGFADVDGFSESDIYAAGDRGNVWHFDGKSWHSCNFPEKKDLFGICCGGDGRVYVCGKDDLFYVLSDGKWSKIHDGTPHTYHPFKTMRWFAEKLWVAAEFKLGHVIDGKLLDAVHNGEKIGAYEYLDERDGVLVLASSSGWVRLFDGDKFHTLVRPYR